jgi:two-component system, NtrC family, response regulator AtoC
MQMNRAVVVVGDDSLRARLARELDALSVETRSAETLERGLELLEEGGFEVLFTDLCFPDGVGFELLEKGRDGLTTVVLGDVDELQAAEEILKYGVADFLSTPIDRTELRAFLRDMRASPNPKVRDGAQGRGADAEGFGPMVGRSPAMQRVFERVKRIGSSAAPVLITGESGTGKELVARAIHDLSARRGAFVAVNCGAIAPTLMESQLFGHEKGSFTGAIRAHRGFFERAHRGTLFLDEITEMSLELQVKLLRVLERSRILRIGAEKHREVDVRVLAATNRIPEKAIKEGKLRKDLYYRLKVLHLALPPLHKREGDIPLLARHFLAEVIEREGHPRELSEDTLDALERHLWPGNARELRNAVYTAYLLCGGDVITPEDLPPEVTGDGKLDGDASDGPGIAVRVGESIDEAERRLILTTLAHVDGNKTQAAEILGVSVKTLYNRLHAYGLMGDSSRGSASTDGTSD